MIQHRDGLRLLSLFPRPRLRPSLRTFLMALLLGGLLATGGCLIARAAAVMAGPPDILPAYTGLKGEGVGVMVWVDRAIATDYQNLQRDAASVVQKQLEEKAKISKDLEKTTFPVKPERILWYQQNYPRVAELPITEVAPKLANRTGMTRLIYLEIIDFGTRSPTSGSDLFRGSITARLKVVGIKDGKAEVVYELPEIKALFPPRCPPDGVPNLSDGVVYNGTLAMFNREVVNLFITHEGEK